MKKLKTKFVTKVPIYGNELIYITGKKDHIKFLTEAGEDTSDANNYVGMVYTSTNGAICIYIQDVSDLKTIHHETIHAAFRILEHVDIKADIENQEALCYLSDWIFNWIITKTNFKFEK